EVGTSPADAEARADGDTDHGTTDGEDPADGGGDELAETGVEVTGPAALAALMLTGGAGLLWHQRRREN
ncbi:MAG: LPXTG cell wall anchor domain-containing protein, partial [Brachybacterium sp.]|nr:LPXTG cell wall anchor domain-containing protein [Brachybacterium sp.]